MAKDKTLYTCTECGGTSPKWLGKCPDCDAARKVPSEFEMYDLLNDPLETINIAHKSYKRTPEQNAQYARMLKKLQVAKSTRLQPLS